MSLPGAIARARATVLVLSAILPSPARPEPSHFPVSLPNGKLADMRIEDFASRDRIRFAATVGLAHGTSEEQVRQIVTDVEAMLRANPRIWPDVVARLAALGASSGS